MRAWMSSTREKKPIFLELRSARWFVLVTVSIAIFSDLFLYAVIVPVLPFALTQRVGISEDEVQYWLAILLAVYAAFVLAFSPIGGWVADRLTTRRLPLLISLLAFAASTLLLMLGRTIALFIVGRALQGVSAAAVWSIGLALLVDTVGPDEVGEAMGYVSLSMSLAIFAAPLLGGVVYDKAGYFAVYYMAIGIIVLDIILRLLLIEPSTAQKWLDQGRNVTLKGSQTASSGLCEEKRSDASEAQVLKAPVASLGRSEQIIPTESADTLSRQPDAGHQSQRFIQAPPRSKAVALDIQDRSRLSSSRISQDCNSAISVAQQKRRRLPATFYLLGSTRLLAALFGIAVVAIVNTTFDTTIPLRVKSIFHWDSIGAGLIFLAVIVPSLLSPLVGKLSDRIGGRLMTSVGMLAICPLMICMRFVDHDSLNQKVLLCALLACLGACAMLTTVPLLAEISYAVQARQKLDPSKFGKRGAFAQGYGLMNASYGVGTLLGPIWSGLVNNEAGWGTMTWSIGLFSGVSATVVFLFLGGWIGSVDWRRELIPFRKGGDEQKADEETAQKVVHVKTDEPASPTGPASSASIVAPTLPVQRPTRSC